MVQADDWCGVMCVLSRYEKYLLVRRCTTGETPGGLALHRGKKNPLTSVREGRLDHRLGPISFAVLRGQLCSWREGRRGLERHPERIQLVWFSCRWWQQTEVEILEGWIGRPVMVSNHLSPSSFQYHLPPVKAFLPSLKVSGFANIEGDHYHACPSQLFLETPQ